MKKKKKKIADCQMANVQIIVFPYRIAYCFNSAFRAVTSTFSNDRVCVCADFVFGIISNVYIFLNAVAKLSVVRIYSVITFVVFFLLLLL